MSLTYYVRRLFLSVVMIWAVASLSFLLLHALPGDPVDMILGDQASNIDKVALRSSLGLDQNLILQYGHFVKGLITLNWGQSIFSHKSVYKEIAEHLPNTFFLAITALLFAVCLSIPLGVLAAIDRHKTWSRALSVLCVFMISLPSFFLAPLLILFFCVRNHWLPIGGNESLSSVLLPAATLSIGLCSVLIQFTKTSVTEFIHQDFVQVLRAKGVSKFKIYFVHVMKNALTPIVSVIGLQLGALLSGALIVESIFDWPGLGTLIYQAVQSREYPLVQHCVLVTALIYAVVHLLLDFIYPILQPRLRT
jgi:ABC-type dipeptide/oligopeptide/nickel transport system permease component